MDNFLHSPIKVAHHYWQELLKPEDIVIDATLGNGQDAYFLATLCKQLIAIDIQIDAIESAKKILTFDHVHYIHGSHAQFPSFILPQSVKLIVYNLGYLPRGDKSIVTKTESTLESLHNALELLMTGGMISITCYSGHEEGANEEEAVVQFASTLDPKGWYCIHHRWLNRNRCPSLVLLNKNVNFPVK